MSSFSLLLIYIFCEYFRPADFIPLLAKFPYMKIIAGLLFLTFFLERGKIDFFAGLRQNRLLAIIIILMVLSVPFAFHRKVCLLGAFNFCKVVMIFLIFLNLVDDLRGLKIVMWTIFLSTFYAMYEIINVYLLGQFWYRFQGARSGVWDANDLAGFLVTVIPLVIGLIRLSKPVILKLVLTGGLATYFIGVVATQSRGGFVGLLAIGACYVFRANKRIVSLFLVGFVAIAMFTILPKDPFERFTSINISERKTGDSTDERIELWKSGIRMAIDHPFLGVGVNCYPMALGTEYNLPFNPRRWATAHNSFILILAEVGVFAFLCYLGVYYLNFKDIKRIKRRLKESYIKPEVKKEIPILCNAFEVSLVGFAVTASFLSRTYSLDMFLITAFIIVLKRVTERLASDNLPQVGIEDPQRGGMDKISAIKAK